MKIIKEGIKLREMEDWEEKLVCAKCKATLLVTEDDLYFRPERAEGRDGPYDIEKLTFQCPHCKRDNDVMGDERLCNVYIPKKQAFFQKKESLKEKKYDKMILTTDLALTINGSEIVLISRTKPPFQDKLVLPGGHFESSDKSLSDACAREALEEISLKIDPDKLRLLKVLDDPKRDPREGRRISVVFRLDLIGYEFLKDLSPASDAKKIHINKIDSLTQNEIGFDHWKVIEELKKK